MRAPGVIWAASAHESARAHLHGPDDAGDRARNRDTTIGIWRARCTCLRSGCTRCRVGCQRARARGFQFLARNDTLRHQGLIALKDQTRCFGFRPRGIGIGSHRGSFTADNYGEWLPRTHLGTGRHDDAFDPTADRGRDRRACPDSGLDASA